MTKLQWIRTLPAEELAKLLRDDCDMCSKSNGDCDMDCRDGYIKWLNEEHIPEIKPCPVCEGKMDIKYRDGYYLVCPDCGLHFGIDAEAVEEGIIEGGYSAEEALVAAWNLIQDTKE